MDGNFFVWVRQVTAEKRHKHFFIWKNVSWVSVRNFFFGYKKIGTNFFFLFLSATVGCIVDYYNPPYGKHRGKTVFLTSCSRKIDFANLHVILLLRVWIFSILKNVFCGCLCLLYSLNELINNNVYFFVSFLKIDLFWFSILWAFGYTLLKPHIIDSIDVPCYNITIMII